MAATEEKNRTIYNAEYGALQSSEKGYSGWVINRRVNLFLREVRPGKNEKILEIGCNDGVLFRQMERLAGECHGIDVNEDIIRRANHPRMQVMSATELKFPDAAFDKIYSSHVIEHIPDLETVFREVFRVLRPGGRFFALFPWEPIRGVRALKDALQLKKGLGYARQLHIHTLTPRIVRRRIQAIPFRKITSRVVFTVLPDFLMTFDK